MAIYGIKIFDFNDDLKIIKEVRNIASLSIGEIKKRLNNKSILFELDDEKYNLDKELVEIHKEIENTLLKFCEFSSQYQLLYKPSEEDEWELIDIKMMKNLMLSDQNYLNQEYD